MIFYLPKKFNNNTQESLILKINEESVVLQYKGLEKNFEFSKLMYYPDKCNIYFNENTNIFNFQWVSDIKEDKIGDYYTKFRYEMNNSNSSKLKLCSIFIDEEKNIYIVPYVKCQDPVIAPTVIINNSFENDKEPLLNIESYRNLVKRFDAKKNLIANINILDSLAALEAQIDIIFSIISSGTENSSFAQIMKDNSVINIHNIDKLLSTIQNNKSRLRSLQRKYISEKGTALSNRFGA